MIVILIKDVKGTGKAGDVVKVSDGFARNRLIPKGMAKEATDGNRPVSSAFTRRREPAAPNPLNTDPRERVTTR